jgi:hypothetical protein
MSDLLKELKQNPEYKKIVEKMSDEERKLAEQAITDMFQQFEQSILGPLKNLKSE